MYSRASPDTSGQIFINGAAVKRTVYPIWIAIAAIVVMLGAAHKRRKGRSNASFEVLPYNTQQALSTLALDTALITNVTGTLVDPLYVISMDYKVAIRALTPTEGPIEIGVCHGDYTVAEVIEALNAGQSITGRGVNKIEQERRRRQVRSLGFFSGETADDALDDGQTKRVKLGWTIGTGKTLNVFEINRGAAAGLTTGAIVEWSGKVYGRWQ